MYAVFFLLLLFVVLFDCASLEKHLLSSSVNTYTHVRSFSFFSSCCLMLLVFLLLFPTSIIIIIKEKNPGQTERLNENDNMIFTGEIRDCHGEFAWFMSSYYLKIFPIGLVLFGDGSWRDRHYQIVMQTNRIVCKPLACLHRNISRCVSEWSHRRDKLIVK